MLSYFRPIGPLVMSATVLLVAGCTSPSREYGDVSLLEPERALLQFRAGPLADAAVTRVAYADPWEYDEYAGGVGNGLRFEMAYVTRVGDNTTLEYPYTLRRMLDTWRRNTGPIVPGKAERAALPIEGMWYLPYTLLKAGESCAGFQAKWDSPANDPAHRPGRVLFGNLCAAAGQALTEAVIDGVLANIGILGFTERLRNREPRPFALGFGETPLADANTRQKILGIARSGPDGRGGNARFPFGLAVTFTPDEGIGIRRHRCDG